ncbi:MAG: hypothetical protein EPN43_11305 [Jatrophihabitans sp.]|nr:MAG: hypothetical protein EPN43_11305 [Jatrophihabitans sp.]
MALSDYERRVLNEIEHDLVQVDARPLLLRALTTPFSVAIGWSLLVAGCVCSAIFAPPEVAVLCVGLVGFGLGVVAGRAAVRVKHAFARGNPRR